NAKNRRIPPFDFEEKRLRKLSEANCGGQPDYSPNDSHQTYLSEDHSTKDVGRRAQSHSKTEFAGALSHSVRKYSVKSDGGKDRPQTRKCSRQNTGDAVDDQVVPDCRFHSAQVFYWKISIQQGDDGSHDRQKILGRHRSPNIKSHGADSFILTVRQIEQR